MVDMQITVTAVVVSYNRADLLQECLDGIASQTRPVDRVIIVDNASTDGAAEVARNHPLVAAADSGTAKVVVLPRNVGGAGGFCAGIALAVEDGFVDAQSSSRHYVWLMDDDTVPKPTALISLLDAVDECVTENRIFPAVLGSKAVWTDGREHLMNKPRMRGIIRKGNRFLSAPVIGDGLCPYQARSMSFVSCLINVGAIRNLGRLPRASYFLWNDDFEYTTALLRKGVGYYVPASEVVHKTKVFGSSDADPGERFYNEVRNKIWLFRFSKSNFTFVELVEFILKTVRRWTLTWLRSRNRALILDCFRRGWCDGVYGTLEKNVDVFKDVDDVARAVASVETD